jgi:hypothetical protein
VRAVDRRDRVELDRLQAPHLGGDIVRSSPAKAAGVALMRDDEAAKGGNRYRGHAAPARARLRAH